MASATKWPVELTNAIALARSLPGTSINEVLEPLFSKSKEELLSAPATPPQVLINLAVFYLRSNFTLRDVSQSNDTDPSFNKLSGALVASEQMTRR